MNKSFTDSIRLFFSAIAILLLGAQGIGFAQTKVDIDENVKVQFLGGWREGHVVETDKKRILVEFEFGSGTQRDVFSRAQIRRMYEVNAMDFGRNWESANGTFKIDAALKNVDGDQVTLIKQDLEEVTVPLEKLSSRDIAYVNKLKKQNDAAIARGQIPALTPDLPELEDFGTDFTGMSTFTNNSPAEMTPLGEIPNFLTQFEHAGFGFKMARKRQELVAVIPVGGPEKLVLLSAREDNFFNRGARFQSQLYWVSLKKSGAKILGTVHITPESFAVDYDPKNRLLLTFHRKARGNDGSDPDHYTLWKLEPGESKTEPLVRWVGSGMNWSQNLFAKIVNDRVVVAKTARQTYQAWDIVDKKSIYEIKSQSFFDAPVVMSPDRKHLIFPEDKQVSVIDAASGELEMGAVINDRHVSGANINPAGTKLAALTERNIYVWELGSGSSEPTVYPAPLMGSPFSSRVEWIDDDHILGQSSSERILYRLSLKLPVWSYKMEVSDYFLNRDPLKNMVVDGKFFYVSRPQRFESMIAVGAVELPGPQVAEVTQNIDRDALMILKPGVHVGVTVESVSDPDLVEQWISKKVEDNDWVLDDNAEIQIHAEMGVGESQTIEYHPIGSSIGSKRQSTTVNFKPHYSSLQIKQGNTIIWQTGTSTGAPPIVHGDDVQEQINQYQNPQLNFFKGVKIDRQIIDPKYSRGFGVSKLGLRGIQVVSTSPPGREDDPLEASRKADEDQQKAYENSQKENGESDKAGQSSNATNGRTRQ